MHAWHIHIACTLHACTEICSRRRAARSSRVSATNASDGNYSCGVDDPKQCEVPRRDVDTLYNSFITRFVVSSPIPSYTLYCIKLEACRSESTSYGHHERLESYLLFETVCVVSINCPCGHMHSFRCVGGNSSC